MVLILLLFTQYFLITATNFFLQIKLSLKIILISILTSIIFSALYLSLGLGSTGLLWVSMGAMNLILIKTDLQSSILTPSLSAVVFIFSDYLTLYLSSFLQNDLMRFTLTCAIFLVLIYLTWRFLTKYLFDELYSPVISLISAGTFFIHFIVIIVERYATNYHHMELVNKSFVVSYSLLSLLVASIMVIVTKNHYRNKENENYLNYLKQYASDIEHKYQDLRTFKHDYQNILLSLDTYIAQGDVNKLRNYFDNNIKNSADTIFDNSLQLSQLSNLNILSLKSILLSKLNSVDASKTKVSILIFEQIDTIGNLDEIPLIRALGIILDNALEATCNCLNKSLIECAILKEEQALKIIISNSFEGEIHPLYQLKKEGFSTKGNDRGLGLSNLDSIVSSEAHLSLETSIVENIFLQVLSIDIGGVYHA